jgi:hypothetical protein
MKITRRLLSSSTKEQLVEMLSQVCEHYSNSSRLREFEMVWGELQKRRVKPRTNLDLCKKCLNQINEKLFDTFRHTEYDWKRSSFNCIKGGACASPVEVGFSKRPPEDCPYILEHALGEEECYGE